MKSSEDPCKTRLSRLSFFFSYANSLLYFAFFSSPLFLYLSIYLLGWCKNNDVIMSFLTLRQKTTLLRHYFCTNLISIYLSIYLSMLLIYFMVTPSNISFSFLYSFLNIFFFHLKFSILLSFCSFFFTFGPLFYYLFSTSFSLFFTSFFLHFFIFNVCFSSSSFSSSSFSSSSFFDISILLFFFYFIFFVFHLFRLPSFSSFFLSYRFFNLFLFPHDFFLLSVPLILSTHFPPLRYYFTSLSFHLYLFVVSILYSLSSNRFLNVFLLFSFFTFCLTISSSSSS
ncbi:unnamed protein product [Acanthosepion pharaonis]|uniref:Uncharacterized protein n=1 Tax=Acanthosepion pharaonis TaxID=158019 RepID=A0A812BLR2_ACAPH|nr:unnamed protein product [Sepia pharaonis]